MTESLKNDVVRNFSNRKVYRIQDFPILGRQLIAVREIIAGELIIDEPALVTGPGFSGTRHYTANAADGEDSLVCLVCCRIFQSFNGITCTSCDLRLCSEPCRSHVQHSENECVVFPQISHVWNGKRLRSRKSFYNLILVIRALFYKLRDSKKWDQLRLMESKVEALEKVGAFSELEDVFNCLSWDQFSFASSSSHPTENKSTEEDIIRSAKHCLGVMRINAFSMFNETYSREGLFFLSSFMSHSCVINTDRQMDVVSFIKGGVATDGDLLGGSRMVVRASVDIQKDEPITTTYLSLLYNTEERNRIMISNWLFTCHCIRCEDPNECQIFSAGIIDISSISTCINPTSILEDKLTSECGSEFHSKETKTALEHIFRSRPTDLLNISLLEDWLDTYDNGTLLHPYHSVFAHVKLFLCQYFGRQNQSGVRSLTRSRLKRKVLYCVQILKIYDKAMPGIQMCRGVLLFELWCALERLKNLKMLPHEVTHPYQEPNNPAIVFYDKDIERVKMEAYEILKYALPNSSEEAMANVLRD